MYKTKKEVDAHVRTAMSKLRTESERQLRSLTIAKLYLKINEYALAEQYLCSYLMVKEDNDQAHKLLGQCYQHLKKPEKALQSFQRSLQLNPKQKDLLVEVCQILLNDSNFNTTNAKYWCDLAESEKVQHDAVFSLRLKLMNKENLNVNQVEELLEKEILSRPNDVQLRVRLVRNYIERKKVIDAFKYICNLEISNNDAFVSSGEWYDVVWLSLNKYEQVANIKKDWEYWLMVIICLEHKVNISFTSQAGTASEALAESANAVFNLDQYLYKVSQLATTLCVQKELLSTFLSHYKGQLLLHAAALIVKREIVKNKNKWKEAMNPILPLLLLAFQLPVTANSKEPWIKHCNEKEKSLIQLWNREASFRCAQAGRILLSCIGDESADNGAIQMNNILNNQPKLWNNCDDFLAQIRKICADKHWRRNIFAVLFSNTEHKVKEKNSMFVNCTELREPQYELPTYAEVERYEEEAQYFKPQSLPHLVYLCLGNDNLAYIRAKYFSGLSYSTQNLAFCGAESLNQLDVDTFLYAATMQAKRTLEVDHAASQIFNLDSCTAGKPLILPFVNIQANLCSEQQINWWTAAYEVYKGLAHDNLATVRANLQFGIEAVRGINGPKIDMVIVFKLGQIFVARAQDIVKPIEKAYLEARAENLYKYGLNMVKMNNKGVLEPFRKYFKYSKPNMAVVEREVLSAAEDAVSYMSSRFFKKGAYEELIDELCDIQLPFATYLQAEAYRKLDEANQTPKQAKRLYLERASECLNQTLSLLKNTQTDPNHPLNSIIHSELKRVQKAACRYNGDSPKYNSGNIGPHNNSSTYEDAEADFYSGTPSLPSTSAFNRSRREAAATLASPHNLEIENLVKQMAKTLTFVKEEIIESIKPEVVSMRKEITSLKDKIAHLEDAMKATRISSNPPSRDDASNVLEDLYMIEDALQNPTYPQPAHNVLYPHNTYSNTSIGGAQAQQQPPQRMNTPNAASMQIQQNAVAAVAAAAAAAYNGPLFNSTYPMNYYTSPFMMPPQGSSGTGGALGQRNVPLSLPYMDGANASSGAYNFTMAPGASLLPPQPSVDQQRTSNLFGLLTQQPAQQNQQLPPVIPQFPVSMPTTPMSSAPAFNSSVATSTSQFNKAVNNQPVEKGPPANVVITSSDPLPKPNSAALQSQQPTLSVTIPSHHIKPSLTAIGNEAHQSTQLNSNQSNVFATQSSLFSFGLANNSNTPLTTVGASFASNCSTSIICSNKSSIISAVTTVSPSNFSFKADIVALNNTENSIKSEQNESSITGNSDAEYDPRPDFKAIIPLPAEIEVKTGEEDEEVVFSCRAKLYRLIEKDWKERGTGVIKILKNKNGFSRVLMRRDQTHKVCANHKIVSELQINPVKNEDKGRMWIANDFADGDLKVETFFARFKTVEIAQQFTEAYKTAQAEAKQNSHPPTAAAPVNKESNLQRDTTDKTLQHSLPTSKAAYVITSTPATKADLLEKTFTAYASEALKDIMTTTSSNSAASKTLFSAPPTSSLSTASVVSTTQTTQTASVTYAPFASFTSPLTAASKTLFSASATSSLSTATTTSPAQNKPGAYSPFATFNFGKLSSPANEATSNTQASTASTTSPFEHVFSNLGMSQPSPFSTANISKSFATEVNKSPVQLNTSEPADEEYVPTAHFAPVIPLPELVAVTTGEENEIVLFEHRAKLLRYDKDVGEWKERGLGKMKVLQDKGDVNKVRLVMRREQIFKLCCNQRLYKNTTFNYAKNSETALTWAGQDFSDNELVTEMLTVRFKTAATCKKFLTAITTAQRAMSSEAGESNSEDKETDNMDTKSVVKIEPELKASSQGFGDEFKAKPGAWSCEACLISNEASNSYCVACESPRDGTVPKKDPSKVTSNKPSAVEFGSFKFGFNSAESDKPNDAKAVFGFNNSDAVANTISEELDKTPAEANTLGFGDKFKPKEGFWTCETCCIPNKPDELHCSACSTPKDNSIPKQEDSSNVFTLPDPALKFNFGFSNGAETTPSTTTAGGFNFAAQLPTIPAAPASKNPVFEVSFLKKSDTEASKSFQFAPPTTYNPSISRPTFSFTMPTSADHMGITAPFVVSSTSTVGSSKSPAKNGGGDADVAEDEDAGEDHHPEEENNTYFTPVVPLPDKIDVKTGEEDEELLYIERAKLYRFADSEWKERGVGDVKILRQKDTKKLRVIMRREPILKLCLNHVLNDDVKYTRKDEKSWHFIVNDFSDGEVELWQFSLRFKNKDKAEDFRNAVGNALAGTAVARENKVTTFKSPISLLSIEQIKLADSIYLPYEFYEEKEKCPGCRGCDPDAFDFSTLSSCNSILEQEDTENKLLPMELPDLTLPKSNHSLETESSSSLYAASDVSSNPSATDSVFIGSSGSNITKSSGSNITTSSGSNITTSSGCNITTSTGVASAGSSTFSFVVAMNSTKQEESKSSEEDKKLPTSTSIFNWSSTISNDDKTGNTLSLFKNSSFGKGASSATGAFIFGGKPVFGGLGATKINEAAPKSIFDIPTSAQSGALGTENPPLASSSNESVTGASGEENPVSNKCSTSIFGNVDKETSSFAVLSDKAGLMDFASLAAKVADPPTTEKSTPTSFVGLTNTSSFQSFQKPAPASGGKSKDNDTDLNASGTEDTDNDENYDPHYDPIIQMPNEIVVSTGEEEETQLFRQRATLYRWDGNTKEWKERGVGELKILLHPYHQKYRMVMRRDQIHKLVLNFAISSDFTFNKLNNNPRGFAWAGMNYAESTNGDLEKLAIRFKKAETAEKYSTTLKECIEAAKKQAEEQTNTT